MRPHLIGGAAARASVIKRNGVVRSFFEKPCVRYRDPIIDYAIVPVSFHNFTYHTLSNYFEGDILERITNKGTEGQEGVAKVWRWEDCPVPDEDYEWGWVEGSADLVVNWIHVFKEKTMGLKLGNVSSVVSVADGEYGMKTSHWMGRIPTGPTAIPPLRQLMELFQTERVTILSSYDVTVSHEWKGTQTKTKHIDMEVSVPIFGTINWLED